MDTDLRTPCEITRESMHAQIADRYLALRKEHPDASNYRLTVQLGKEFRFTPYGIRTILIRRGVFEPAKKRMPRPKSRKARG